MNNRILSILVLIVIFTSLFGSYYYFFVASTGNLTLVFSETGTTSVKLVSEFKKTYIEECEKTCTFEDIPMVTYTLSAKREDYMPLEKTFTFSRGSDQELVITMEKKVALVAQKKKKEETIENIKLQKSIQENIENTPQGTILGYRENSLYYALPWDIGWDIFIKKEWVDSRRLFRIPDGIIMTGSLDIYEGYIAQKKGDTLFFYSLIDGKEFVFNITGNILSVKDTKDTNTKIITNEQWVFFYSMSDKIIRENPLYDDIIQVPSIGTIVLVKKGSTKKKSLLSITDTGNDFVFLIGDDTRERKILLKTQENGSMLQYKNGEILFVTEEGNVFIIDNIQ